MSLESASFTTGAAEVAPLEHPTCREAARLCRDLFPAASRIRSLALPGITCTSASPRAVLSGWDALLQEWQSPTCPPCPS